MKLILLKKCSKKLDALHYIIKYRNASLINKIGVNVRTLSKIFDIAWTNIQNAKTRNNLLFLVYNMFKLIKTKMILIVRTDLKMSKGKIAAQCAHAAVSLYAAASASNRDPWLSSGQPKIVLKIDENCEENLIKLYDLAKGEGLNACLVRDAGKTQIKQGSFTVLGIGPNLSTDIDKISLNLKLL